MLEGDAILFWSAKRHGHAELSNFYQSPFVGYRRRLDATTAQGAVLGEPDAYASVEHYFQSEKFRGSDDAWRRHILTLSTPKDAAAAGRDRSHPLRRDWDARRDAVMRVALWYKFTQNAALTRVLLETAPYRLVEDSPLDAYWGWGADRRGENRLGQLLMEVRAKLAAPEKIERCIIAGGRGYTDYREGVARLDALFQGRRPDEVISGNAAGADTVGEIWALNRFVPVRHFPARWDDLEAPGAVVRERNGRRYNAVAGHQRNQQMADVATRLVVFWDGKSRGTRDMVQRAEAAKLPVDILRY